MSFFTDCTHSIKGFNIAYDIPRKRWHVYAVTTGKKLRDDYKVGGELKGWVIRVTKHPRNNKMIIDIEDLIKLTVDMVEMCAYDGLDLVLKEIGLSYKSPRFETI